MRSSLSLLLVVDPGENVVVIGGRCDIVQQATLLFLDPHTLVPDIRQIVGHRAMAVPPITNAALVRLWSVRPISIVGSDPVPIRCPGSFKLRIVQHLQGKGALMNVIRQRATDIGRVGSRSQCVSESPIIGFHPLCHDIMSWSSHEEKIVHHASPIRQLSVRLDRGTPHRTHFVVVLQQLSTTHIAGQVKVGWKIKASVTDQLAKIVFERPHGTNGGIRVHSTIQGQEFGAQQVAQFDGTNAVLVLGKSASIHTVIAWWWFSNALQPGQLGCQFLGVCAIQNANVPRGMQELPGLDTGMVGLMLVVVVGSR